MLDPKGLEAAIVAVEERGCVHFGGEIEAAIRAYLSTVTPAEVGGLVERLLRADLDAVQQAASLIQSQAARIAELEAGLKPFALAAAVYDYAPPIYSDDDKSDSSLERSPLTVGDFRHARSLLNGERKG